MQRRYQLILETLMDPLAQLYHDSRSVLDCAEGTTNDAPLFNDENLAPVHRSLVQKAQKETWKLRSDVVVG